MTRCGILFWYNYGKVNEHPFCLNSTKNSVRSVNLYGVVGGELQEKHTA